MGLEINSSTLLYKWFSEYNIAGPLLTLGVQNLDFTWREFYNVSGHAYPEGNLYRTPTAKELFTHIGFSESFSLDISDYEGADFIADLNVDVPAAPLFSRFGCILNGGTLEHVFNIPHALTAITRMLRPGGVVIHVVPVHNWIDHGFYQINPTLLFEYYRAARFDILESVGLVFSHSVDKQCDVMLATPGAFASRPGKSLDGATVLCVFVARKTAASLDRATPQQSAADAAPPATLRWFAPYSTVRGKPSGGAYDELPLGPFHREEGRAWAADLPASVPPGDSVDAPHRSLLALFEDEHLLGPAHALHDVVRRQGGGSYSHWNQTILFSPLDDSDPNSNGRSYIAKIPRG